MTIELLHGDCLAIMPHLSEHSVDLVLADLPYGETAAAWDRIIDVAELWLWYQKLLRPGGAVVLFGVQPFTSLLITSNLKHYRYSWIWEKNRPTNHLNAAKMPLRAHEDICVFGPCAIYNPQMERGDPYRYFNARHQRGSDGIYHRTHSIYHDNHGARQPTSILRFDAVHGGVHPTQKPVALLSYLIRTYTNEDDLVLDNTMGSGSTLVACVQTNRNGIGIELREDYFADATRRVAAAQAQPVLIGEDEA